MKTKNRRYAGRPRGEIGQAFGQEVLRDAQGLLLFVACQGGIRDKRETVSGWDVLGGQARDPGFVFWEPGMMPI